MDRLMEKYYEKVSTPCDINEHLGTLKSFCEGLGIVIEIGVRDVVSTYGMLAGRPKKMISYDLWRSSYMAEAEEIAEEAGIDFEFKIGDSLEITIEECDLLFIDTYHTYMQLIQELHLHSSRVKRYIAMHDTYTFGQTDERMARPTKPMSGLLTAVNEFLKENKNWVMIRQDFNNNGLTILQRVGS